NDKFYFIPIGSSLLEALETPLKNEELKSLGLAGDPEDGPKKGKKGSTKKRKPREGFWATCVKTCPKQTKGVPAPQAKPGEMEAPDRWIVRDTFGSEMTRFIVVRIEKDKLYFWRDKTFFVIDTGGSLFDALAKPLKEDEVKKLELKAP